MLRKLIAIDSAYANRVAKDNNFDYFPIEGFCDVVKGDGEVDVIETLITLIKRVPEDDSPEEIATVASQVERTQHALEMKGCRVIICPAKRSGNGEFKQSDDQRLMITTLSTCLKLRPDFLVFVGADGDYAPMVWELRNEGIRTEVAAGERHLASDLKRAAYSIVDLEEVFEKIEDEGAAAQTSNRW